MTDRKTDDQHAHPPGAEGLAADLPHFLTRRRLFLAGLATAGAAVSLLAARSGSGRTLTATAPDGSVCVQMPTETEGPFPADGTNVREGQTVNILTDSGVLREDIRGSIGGLTAVAEGVPIALEITLVDLGRACAPLAGHAVYVWQCDAEGIYSIYAAQDRNYLRGVGVSDAEGRVRFTTVFPACYPGRWPHLHFEVFAGAEAAVTGNSALLTSQFALPEADCRAVYAAHPLYAGSVAPFADITIASDGIFRDATPDELQVQILQVVGDPVTGYRATGRVALLV